MNETTARQTSIDDYDSLGYLDRQGYTFEMSNLVDLRRYQTEFGFRIAYHNPENEHDWKRTKGHGTDKTIELRNRDGIKYVIHIEESFCSWSYWYRRRWFDDCRLKRFDGKPHGRYDIWVILTNRPYNFKGLGNYSKQKRVKIFNMGELLYYIKRLRNSSFITKAAAASYQGYYNQQHGYTVTDNANKDTNTNNVYANPKNYKKVNDKSLISNPEHEKWLLEQIDKLKKSSLYCGFND
jgi:hypothetical protein